MLRGREGAFRRRVQRPFLFHAVDGVSKLGAANVADQDLGVLVFYDGDEEVADDSGGEGLQLVDR